MLDSYVTGSLLTSQKDEFPLNVVYEFVTSICCWMTEGQGLLNGRTRMASNDAPHEASEQVRTCTFTSSSMMHVYSFDFCKQRLTFNERGNERGRGY